MGSKMVDVIQTWEVQHSLFLQTLKNKINFYYKLYIQHCMLKLSVLQALDQHEYLGVTLSSNMKWNAHIDKAISKASSMIGFRHHNLGNAPEKVKIQAYKSPVPPHGEYCSSVWDPHTKRYIQKVKQSTDELLVSSPTTMAVKAQLPTCLPTWSFLPFNKDVSTTD